MRPVGKKSVEACLISQSGIAVPFPPGKESIVPAIKVKAARLHGVSFLFAPSKNTTNHLYVFIPRDASKKMRHAAWLRHAAALGGEKEMEFAHTR